MPFFCVQVELPEVVDTWLVAGYWEDYKDSLEVVE